MNEYNWANIANQGSDKIVRSLFEASYGHIQMSAEQRLLLEIAFYRGFGMSMGLIKNVVLNPNLPPAHISKLMNQVDAEITEYMQQKANS